MFTPEDKGKAVSLLTASMWMFNAILTTSFLPLIARLERVSLFGFFGCVGATCVFLMWLFLPETKRLGKQVAVYE